MSQTSALQIATEAFVDQIDSDVAAYREACVHCGECAEACHFYEATNDPRYRPTYKLTPLVTAYKRLKSPLAWFNRLFGAPELTAQELGDWEDLVYDSGTMCGRCTLVCPMGIDIAGIIRKMGEGGAAAGLVPEGLQQARKNVEVTSSPIGAQAKALLIQIGKQEQETGLNIPVDVEGADYLALFSSHEIMASPEIVGAYAKIFDRAGVSWTVSTQAYEATNVGVQIGSAPLARDLVQRIVDEAERLGVKHVIAPDGRLAASASWDGTVALWSFEGGEPTSNETDGCASDLAFSPDGTRFYVATTTGSIDVHELGDPGAPHPLVSHGFGVNRLHLAPDGSWLAYGAVDGTARMMNTETGALIADFTPDRRPILALAHHPGSGRLAVGDGQGFIMLIDTRSWSILRGFRATINGPIWALAFSPDGAVI